MITPIVFPSISSIMRRVLVRCAAVENILGIGPGGIVESKISNSFSNFALCSVFPRK